MKPIHYKLIKNDGRTVDASWASWYECHEFREPYYDEDLNRVNIYPDEPPGNYLAYGVTVHDETWDRDSGKFALHFPILFYERDDATYMLEPGDTAIHDTFKIELSRDVASFETLLNNLKTLYELQRID